MYRSPDWGDSLLIFTKSERWILLECNKLAWNICSKYVKVMIHLVQHKVELCHMITPGLFDVFTMNSCVTSWRNKKGCVSMMVVVPLLPQCCMAHGKTHPTLCLKKMFLNIPLEPGAQITSLSLKWSIPSIFWWNFMISSRRGLIPWIGA